MSLSINDIVENPSLRTRLLAGAGGLGRRVEWAHATDVDHPWEWLGSGELFMTLGRNFPTSAQDQMHFIKACSDADLAGIDIAEGWFSPKLTKEAVELANELDFPIIETGYEIPFASLTKAVADSTQRSRQASEIMQVYECYRISSMAQRTETEILTDLAEHMGAQWTIVKIDSGTRLLKTHSDLPAGVITEIQSLNKAGPLPAIKRLVNTGQNYLVMPIHGKALALVSWGPGSHMDLIVMQHATAVASLVADRLLSQMKSRITYDSQLLSHLLNGSVDFELARARLNEIGLGESPWQILSIAANDQIDVTSVYVNLMIKGISAIATNTKFGLFVLLAVTTEIDKSFMDIFGKHRLVAGVSQEFSTLSRLIDAARESVWARESSSKKPGKICVYGASQSPYFPRTLPEAREAIDLVLGELIAYDTAHDAHLVHTLRVFFQSRRSWQVASRELDIHRQTLVYRLQRIGEITNRDLGSVEDIAALHMALQAADFLEQI